MGGRAVLTSVALLAGAFLLSSAPGFVGSPASQRTSAIKRASGELDQTPTESFLKSYGERDPLPQGYGIRTGLSDLLKPLNSIPTYIVLLSGILLLFLFYVLLLLINNQSVLLPPEDEFDEYVANFLPYFFFGEK
eukprot:UN4637